MMHAAMNSAMSHICLVVDPVLKLGYLEAIWNQEYLDKEMECFKSQVVLIRQLAFLWSNFHVCSFLFTKKNTRLLSL